MDFPSEEDVDRFVIEKKKKTEEIKPGSREEQVYNNYKEQIITMMTSGHQTFPFIWTTNDFWGGNYSQLPHNKILEDLKKHYLVELKIEEQRHLMGPGDTIGDLEIRYIVVIDRKKKKID